MPSSEMRAATPLEVAESAVETTWSRVTCRPTEASPPPVLMVTWIVSLEAGTGTASPRAAKSEAWFHFEKG